MVRSVSSVGRNGVQDFILLRVTAVILTFYTLYLLGFFLGAGEVTYPLWLDFWSMLKNKVFTLLALLSVLIHAWIGLWQVLSDYIKSALLRGVLQSIVVVTLFAYLFTGLFVLWGV